MTRDEQIQKLLDLLEKATLLEIEGIIEFSMSYIGK